MARERPDRAALEIAHRRLGVSMPLDEMLKDPAQRLVLENRARRHMKKRDRFDVRRAQANDND